MKTLAKSLLLLGWAMAGFASSVWAGASISYEYDDYGNCTAITTKDSSGDTLEKTTYAYDDYRRLTKMVEAAHTTSDVQPPSQRRQWNWVYDRYFDGPGLISSLAHTSKKWRVQIEPAYDVTGNRRLSAQKFDYNDQVIEVATGLFEAPNGNYVSGPDTELHYFSYDKNGNKETFTDPRGRLTTYEYDLRNRLKKTIEPLNRITETLYDTTGNKTDVTFPDTRSQHWRDYDAFGQPWTFIDERNNTTSLTYQWGPMKKLQTVTTYRDKDSGGTEPQRTTFYYSDIGLPQTTVFPDGSEEWSFYEFGQLKHFWTRKRQIKTINYDARGREISHSWSDPATPAISRSWDDANRVKTFCNIFSTIDFDYDGAGLVWKEGNTIAGSGARRETVYQRYRDGAVSEIKYPDGMSVRRDYTARGQLKSVSENMTGPWRTAIGYNYYLDGKVSYQDYGNGTRTNFDYDERGMTRALHHHRVSPYQNYAYRYYWRDERDRITAFRKLTDNSVNPMENGTGDRFRYDEEGQVVEGWYNATDPANSGAGNLRYDGFNYDALGNRRFSNYLANKGSMTFTRKDNGLNQARAWWPYSIINYDDDLGGGWGSPGAANGVVMQDGWITAGFNALNQPMMIWSATNPGGAFLWFGHDPLGRCVKRWLAQGDGSGANSATYFYYDGWNLIEEGSSATSPQRNYVHGARVDEIVLSSNAATGQHAYHHYDARGHAVLLTNSSGGILEQYEYDAFGHPYFYDAQGQPMTVNGQPGSTFGNRFLFTGREYLRDLKLYDYRNRLYQPELGRFLQPDPIQFKAGDYNLYRYCHNDPVNKNDPTGLLVDTIADVGFIAYDVYRLFADGAENRAENWSALGLDTVAAVVPFATGAGAAFRGAKALERASEAAGRVSKYEDTTKAGSRLINRTTDVTRSQFEKNLTNGGWQKSVSKDGKVTNYEKDGAKYSVRDNAKSTGGPTADYYKPGSEKPDIKIRLQKDQ